jgi:hypothetical protein
MVVPEGIFLVKFLFGTLPATIEDVFTLLDAVLVDKGERRLSTTFLVMVV